MITKETFVRIINQLREINDLTNKVNDLCSESSNDMVRDFARVEFCAHEDIVVEPLEHIFEDGRDKQYGISEISYYIWELDYGREWKPGMITGEDGVDIKMETPEELYDVLMHNIEVRAKSSKKKANKWSEWKPISQHRDGSSIVFQTGKEPFLYRQDGKRVELKGFGHKASARCHPKDYFDEDKGLRLCFARLKLKQVLAGM